MTGKLSGAEKAAILLLALGEDISGELLRHLSAAEVRHVATAISRTGRIEATLVDAVLAEFHDQLATLNTSAKQVVGGSESAIAMLKKVKGFDTATFKKSLSNATPPVLASLEHADAKTLARILQKEAPQTIAAVLAHLDAAKFGKTLKHLPAALHAEVIIRVGRLERVDPEIMAEIDQTIQAELAKTAAPAGGRQLGGPAAVAAMLNSLDSLSNGDGDSQAKELLATIAARHPDLASEIEQLLFVFADLSKLDSRAIQKLLTQVPAKILTYALKGASQKLREQIFANMSPRASARLRDDIESLQKLKRTDVEAAQREIARLARSLIDKGEIILPGQGDEYV